MNPQDTYGRYIQDGFSYNSGDSYDPSDESPDSSDRSEKDQLAITDDDVILNEIPWNILEVNILEASPRGLEAANIGGEDESQNTSELAVKPRARSKRSNPDSWKRTINKKLRMSGKEYTNRGGRVIEIKNPKIVNCSKCRYKCNDNFSEEARIKLCAEFWNIGDTMKQKLFLSSCLKNVNVKRRKTSAIKQRFTSREYFLQNDGGRKRVCLKFLCATFSISHRIMEFCGKDVSGSGLYDRRQGKVPHNRTGGVTTNLLKNT